MDPVVLVVEEHGRKAFLLALAQPGGDVPGVRIVGRAFATQEGGPDWATFAPNPAFLDFYARYMRGEAASRPRALSEARVRPGEYLYILDPRTPTPQGDVPPADIVGSYQTDAAGAPRPETFSYNARHLMASPDRGISGVLRDAALWEALAGQRL